MLKGHDLSIWDDGIPAKTQFVILRATYGDGYDTKYARFWADARKRGVCSLAYAFGRNQDVKAQVDTFLSTAPRVGKVYVNGKWHDGYALDLEADGKWPPMTDAQARAFIAEMHRRGKSCGLYHSKSGFPRLGQDFDWVAAWDGVSPGTGWAFHQFTSNNGTLDEDYFYGDASMLAAWKETNPVKNNPGVAGGGIASVLILLAEIATGQSFDSPDKAISALVIAAAPLVASLITRQWTWPNSKVIDNGDGTATPAQPPAGGASDRPAPAASIVISRTPLPSGFRGVVNGTKGNPVRRFDAEDPYKEVSSLTDGADHTLSFGYKVVLSGGVPHGVYLETRGAAPVLIAEKVVRPEGESDDPVVLPPDPATLPVAGPGYVATAWGPVPSPGTAKVVEGMADQTPGPAYVGAPILTPQERADLWNNDVLAKYAAGNFEDAYRAQGGLVWHLGDVVPADLASLAHPERRAAADVFSAEQLAALTATNQRWEGAHRCVFAPAGQVATRYNISIAPLPGYVAVAYPED